MTAVNALRSLCAVASDVLSVIADALDEHDEAAFNEDEAADFFTTGGRMNSAAGVAAEPRSAPVEPVLAPGADHRLRSDPAFLLREAANLLTIAADYSISTEASTYGLQLGAALRDLATQFEADQLTP